mgnify:FL=1
MTNWHLISRDKLFAGLDTAQNGLSAEQAASRLKKHGQNVIKEKNKGGALKLFISQFKDFMVLLLIAAAAVSAVISFVSKDTRELFDTVIIVFIIFLNATVGFVQQYRADKAIEKLKNMAVSEAKVMRGGRVLLADSRDLVPGDVVLLEEGDLVPADCRILSSAGLRCDESALTGESYPVDKDAEFTPTPDAGVGDRKNMLFSSSFVVGGEAKAVVVATGMDTEIGKIAGMLDSQGETATPLQKNLDLLGRIISYGVIAIAVIIFAFGVFFKHNPLIENFMSSVAIAVAAIPEGLPAVVTIIMAMGMQKMSRNKAIVRKLHAVETLGSCNFICSDKTGTLTENKMKVVKISCRGDERKMLQCMRTCNSVKGGFGAYIGDPTETALVTYAALRGAGEAEEITDRKPFDSARKLMSVYIGGKGVTYVKGAPDVLIDRCAYVASESGVLPMTKERRAEILADNAAMARDALRVLGFACKNGAFGEDNLVFLGLAGMMDPPRGEVPAAVTRCKKAGITPVMITGDHRETAFAVARRLGIADSAAQVVTGEQLERMSVAELRKTVERCRVYARVSPKHKSMIVEALQSKGNVVAMTGDGINDAPSIKKADIGIAMGVSGTDVTKNASDMIISDDNFATIVLAVGEGRRIFSNIKKTIAFFLATNLAEVLSIFIVSVLFCRFDFLLSAQLLWLNLVTDSFPVLALGMERAEPDIMERKPKRAEKAVFSKESVLSMCFFGGAITVITLAVFFVSLALFGNATATTMTFFTLSFAELFHAFNIRSDRQSVFRTGIFSNKALLLTVIGGIAVNIAVYAAAPLKAALGISALTVWQWVAVFLSALAVIPLGEIYKFFLRRRLRKKGEE